MSHDRPLVLVLWQALVSSFPSITRSSPLPSSDGIDHCTLRLGGHVRCRPVHTGWRTSRPRPGTVNAIMNRELLVPVHGHTLTVSAHLTTLRWRDGARVAANSRALLEGEQLLGTEGLVVDLRGGLDEVLEMGAGQEVTEVDEFAVGLVLDCEMLVTGSKTETTRRHTVNDTPLVLATTNVPTVHNDSSL